MKPANPRDAALAEFRRTEAEFVRGWEVWVKATEAARDDKRDQKND